MRNIRLMFSSLACFLAVLSAGCGVSTAKPHAEAAVAQFHKQLNAGDYQVIWNGADDDLKSATQHEQFEKLLVAVHKKLGAVVKTANVGWQVKTQNFKTLTVLAQDTQFEHGTGRETFTFMEDNGKARLLGYYINSLDMMTL